MSRTECHAGARQAERGQPAAGLEKSPSGPQKTPGHRGQGRARAPEASEPHSASSSSVPTVCWVPGGKRGCQLHHHRHTHRRGFLHTCGELSTVLTKHVRCHSPTRRSSHGPNVKQPREAEVLPPTERSCGPCPAARVSALETQAALPGGEAALQGSEDKNHPSPSSSPVISTAPHG